MVDGVERAHAPAIRGNDVIALGLAVEEQAVEDRPGLVVRGERGGPAHVTQQRRVNRADLGLRWQRRPLVQRACRHLTAELLAGDGVGDLEAVAFGTDLDRLLPLAVGQEVEFVERYEGFTLGLDLGMAAAVFQDIVEVRRGQDGLALAGADADELEDRQGGFAGHDLGQAGQGVTQLVTRECDLHGFPWGWRWRRHRSGAQLRR